MCVFITLPLDMVSRALRLVKKGLILLNMLPKSCQTLTQNAVILGVKSSQFMTWPVRHFSTHETISFPDPSQKNRGHDRSANSSVSRSPKFISVLAGSLIASLEGDRAWIRLHVFASNCGWLTGLFAFSNAKKLLHLL